MVYASLKIIRKKELLKQILLLFLITFLLTMSCSDSSKKNNLENLKSNKVEKTVSKVKKKVLLVNSYHKGYFWTDGITNAILESFGSSVDSYGIVDNSNSQVTLNIAYMDTRRNPSEAYIKKIAISVKEHIDFWQPDLVITTDDNAAKYLIVPYFKNSDLPFVFCGVNWDASNYGFPVKNVTGMIEVQLIDQLIKNLRKHAKGDRIAFIKGDDFLARKEAKFFEKKFNIKLIKRFVKNFAEWQQQYNLLQKEADIILVGNTVSIPDWDGDEAKKLVNKVTRVPSGNWDESMIQLNLITFAIEAKEQGEWAGNAALEILSGISPADIPLVRNKVARITLNMTLARKLGVRFPIELIEQGVLLEAK